MTASKTINSSTLKGWLVQGKKVNILDIRTDAERDEWLIPESIHFNAYDKLKSGDHHALDSLNIDKDLPVVTVCAKGRMSMLAAEILSEKGHDAYSLEGGMNSWNYAWDTSELILGDVKIIQVRRVAKGCLSYLIGSGDQAMVMDASLDPAVYGELAKENRWSITYVTDTHIHADYVSRTPELAKTTGAKHLIMESAQVAFPIAPLKNGEIIRIGNTKIKAVHTPGHTWESTSFVIEGKAVFTGDTLFTDGIGRPDLKADEYEARRKAGTLYDSLQSLLSLKENTLVLPAHISQPVAIGQGFIAARIGELKKSIKALAFGREEFIRGILAKLPAAPPNYLTIAKINKSGDSKDLDIAELEAGANRCAVK